MWPGWPVERLFQCHQTMSPELWALGNNLVSCFDCWQQTLLRNEGHEVRDDTFLLSLQLQFYYLQCWFQQPQASQIMTDSWSSTEEWSMLKINSFSNDWGVNLDLTVVGWGKFLTEEWKKKKNPRINKTRGAGEMALQLWAGSALPEDLSSIPSGYKDVSHCMGIQHLQPLQAPAFTCIFLPHIHTLRHNNNKYFK